MYIAQTQMADLPRNRGETPQIPNVGRRHEVNWMKRAWVVSALFHPCTAASAAAEAQSTESQNSQPAQARPHDLLPPLYALCFAEQNQLKTEGEVHATNWGCALLGWHEGLQPTRLALNELPGAKLRLRMSATTFTKPGM